MKHHLLGVLVAGSVGEAVVVEQAHLLVEQAVHHVGSGVLPLEELPQPPVQIRAQVHMPVIAVEGDLVHNVAGGALLHRAMQSSSSNLLVIFHIFIYYFVHSFFGREDN